MIDWPNLIAGAVLDFLLAIVPWMLDCRRAKAHRRTEAAMARISVAREIELATQPASTSTDL